MNHKTISVLAKTMVPLIAEPVKKLRDEHELRLIELQERIDGAVLNHADRQIASQEKFAALAQRLDELEQRRSDEVSVLILRIEELEKQNDLLNAHLNGSIVSMTSVVERVTELEQRAPVPGPQGEPGKDGRDGIDGKDGAPGKDGRDGIDGKDGADGRDGADGTPGEKGADGRDGIDGKDGAPGLIGPEGPAGKDGEPGRDGIDGKDGAQGLIGPEGPVGKEGEPGRDGRDGQQGVPGRDGAPGLNGKDGVDGRDGLGFDDMSAEYDGERTVTLKWQRGDQTKEFTLLLPIPLDQGTYRSGAQYQKGDMVTFGGSSWIAQRDTTAKPETSPDWRLAVKRGRDGKDGKPGEKGERGLPGKDGKWQ